jgi:hypothetical protein
MLEALTGSCQEDEDIVIEVEPYGHHVRPTILSNRCERGRACFV